MIKKWLISNLYLIRNIELCRKTTVKKNHSCLGFKQIIRKSDFRIKTWKYEDGDLNGVLNTMDTIFYECRLIEINRKV